MAKRATTTFAKTEKAFGRMAKAIDGGKLDQLVLSGAEQMLEVVKSQCPVKSGKLRDSLYIDKPGSRSRMGAPGRSSHLSVENLYCSIATDLYYAWFVEYGTTHSQAYPFMRPVVDTAAGPMIDAVQSAVTDLVIEALVQSV